MVTVTEFGTDFKSNYNFKNGDLEIVSDKENIKQAIINRLNTIDDWYSLFYNTYGGFLHSFHGWKRLQSTLNFMQIEVTNVLSQDPRLTNLNVELEFNSQGAINMYIDLVYNEDSDLSLSFVIDNSGVTLENNDDE